MLRPLFMRIFALAALPIIVGHECVAADGASALEKMPRDLEVRFALSALPPILRAEASVYVLDPQKGYVLDHKGTNAQTCFVERTEWQWEDYSDDVYTPLCFDKAGMESHGKVWFDVAEMRAQGVPPETVKKTVEKRFNDSTYGPPERAGVSYMIAPLIQGYSSFDFTKKDKHTHVLPHVMYYAPNVTDADFGGIRPPSPFPFIRQQGPQGNFIQHLGEKETEEILKSESKLLKDLCAYRSYLCL